MGKMDNERGLEVYSKSVTLSVPIHIDFDELDSKQNYEYILY